MNLSEYLTELREASLESWDMSKAIPIKDVKTKLSKLRELPNEVYSFLSKNNGGIPLSKKIFTIGEKKIVVECAIAVDHIQKYANDAKIKSKAIVPILKTADGFIGVAKNNRIVHWCKDNSRVIPVADDLKTFIKSLKANVKKA